jgi:hypothetical protein
MLSFNVHICMCDLRSKLGEGLGINGHGCLRISCTHINDISSLWACNGFILA